VQMFLTHFGRVTEVTKLASDLHEQIDAMADIARAHATDADRHAKITRDLAWLYISRAKSHGCTFDDGKIRDLLSMDIELNAQGLEVWVDRQKPN
jgi:hypothetical protein